MQPSDLDVSHGFVRVNGLRYHYVEKGTGPLVLLLHGFPENWWAWRYQIGALAEAGFRVVVPDQRGYNETDKSGPFDLDTLASDAAALIAALGESRAHVVGHDWGGAVAWHLAATRPELVERLVVLGCPHPARMVETLWSSTAQLKRSWPFLLLQLPVLPERGLSRFAETVLARIYRVGARDDSRLGADETHPFVQGLRAPGAAKAMILWHRAAFRQAVRQLGRVPDYPVIEAPALLLWGTEDAFLLHQDLIPTTERYAPRLTVELLDGAGHFLQAERPERVNALLTAFLSFEQLANDKDSRSSALHSVTETAAEDGSSHPAHRPAPLSAVEATSVPRVLEEPRSFTVVLAEAGDNKIGVIKEIRDITGLKVGAAKELVEGAPRTVKSDASRQDAERIRHQLMEVGATVEIKESARPGPGVGKL